MFGVAFSELAVVALVALVVVGPKKLPGMLRTVGEWVARLRRLTTEMRAQTGIDAILREEGIDGVRELRSLLRGEIQAARSREPHSYYGDEPPEPDALLEFPSEGADAGGALPDDLVAPPLAAPHVLSASLGASASLTTATPAGAVG